jgi:hypothetical protein
MLSLVSRNLSGIALLAGLTCAQQAWALPTVTNQSDHVWYLEFSERKEYRALLGVGSPGYSELGIDVTWISTKKPKHGKITRSGTPGRRC